jgi:hypothetical protein
MLNQVDFDKFVSNYNADYLYLLTRASSGHYDCLITSFRVLKDLHDVIIKLHDTTELVFKIIPFPLSLRTSQEFLSNLGFKDDQIQNIRDFLGHVKRTQGREFEECMEEAVLLKCVTV